VSREDIAQAVGSPGVFSFRLLGRWRGRDPVLVCSGGEECRFSAAEREQDRVFCSPVGGLGRDVSHRSP